MSELNPPKSFVVKIASSGQEIVVEENRTILDSLERADIYPDNSCRDGICGTCETRVISGTPDHRDMLLNEEEQASGKTILLCVSRSQSPLLELDL